MLQFYDHGKASVPAGGLQQFEIRNKQLTHIIIKSDATDFTLKIEGNTGFHSGIVIDNYKKAELKRAYDIEFGAVDNLCTVINIGHLQLSSSESLILYITNNDAAAKTFVLTSVELYEQQDFLYLYNRSTVMNNSLQDVNLVMVKDSFAATDSVDLYINDYHTIISKDTIDSLNAVLKNENYDDQTCDVIFYAIDAKPNDIAYEIKSATAQTVLYRQYKLDKNRVASGTPRILDDQLKRIERIQKRDADKAKAFQYMQLFPERKATVQASAYLKAQNARKIAMARPSVNVRK